MLHGREPNRTIIKHYSCGVRQTHFSSHCQLHSENIIFLHNLTFLMIFCLSRTYFGSDFCKDNDTTINQLMISIRRLFVTQINNHYMYVDEFGKQTLFKFIFNQMFNTLFFCFSQTSDFFSKQFLLFPCFLIMFLHSLSKKVISFMVASFIFTQVVLKNTLNSLLVLKQDNSFQIVLGHLA